MISLLEEYFLNIFYDSDTLNFMEDIDVTINNATMELAEYFALICSIISLIIIVVLCCLFIYRLVRLVGRLFSGGAL